MLLFTCDTPPIDHPPVVSFQINLIPSYLGMAKSSTDDIAEDGTNLIGMAMSCPEGQRQAPIWVGDDENLPMDSLLIPMHYEGMIDSILVPKGLISDRIEKLAQTIRRDYDGVTVHLICILKGGSAFFEELCNQLRAIHRFSQREYVPFTFDFVKVSSYKGLSSSGAVSVSGMDLASLAGKHCLLVEDIVDTGRTMTHLLPLIKRSAVVTSLRVATLLEKRTPKSCGFKAQYCGFSIPDKFVIGYNLDYNDAVSPEEQEGSREVGSDRFVAAEASWQPRKHNATHIGCPISLRTPMHVFISFRVASSMPPPPPVPRHGPHLRHKSEGYRVLRRRDQAGRSHRLQQYFARCVLEGFHCDWGLPRHPGSLTVVLVAPSSRDCTFPREATRETAMVRLVNLEGTLTVVLISPNWCHFPYHGKVTALLAT